jgi:ABC-type multidrug transport system ATPase subunit
MMYGGLTTQQNLELLCSLNGQALPQESISKWGLSEHLHTRTSLLSRGLTTRLSLVRALTSQAQLLLFDEPTSNLDDSSTNLFIDTVSAKVTERCVAIIATHDISRLLPVASRVLVLGRGTIVADSGSGGDISEALDIYHRLNR